MSQEAKKFTVLDFLQVVAKENINLNDELMVRLGSDRFKVRIAAGYKSGHSYNSWIEIVPCEDAVENHIQNKAESLCTEMARKILSGA